MSAADVVPAVPAAIPLSLLEAIRGLDTPPEGVDELAVEVVARRLGLSATVAAQIVRYRAAAEAGETVPRDEAVAVFRLVGRRPDAALAFADAGRRVARHAARQRTGAGRAVQKLTPDVVGARLGRRAATRLAREVLGAELRFRGGIAEARLADPLSLRALPDGAACAFYSAAFAELLRQLTGFEGTTPHERCRGRGDDTCLWRAAPAEELA
ncbi:MAG TPA: hypothetical protein VFS40_04025 [Gemmatimonadales bacterium]|nr:hypothetical protein [Gemmatimonadales bacterium]